MRPNLTSLWNREFRGHKLEFHIRELSHADMILRVLAGHVSDAGGRALRIAFEFIFLIVMTKCEYKRCPDNFCLSLFCSGLHDASDSADMFDEATTVQAQHLHGRLEDARIDPTRACKVVAEFNLSIA